MKNELKKQLDEQVFVKNDFVSQKEQIMKRIEKKPKKSSRIIHTGLSIAAIILFSILSISYLTSNDLSPAQEDNNPTVIDKEKQPENETVEKTGDEWKQTFLDVWSKPREPFQKLYLIYTSTSHHLTGVRTITNDIMAKYENDKLFSKTSMKIVDTGETKFEISEDIYLNGQQITHINHSEKNFSSGEVTGTPKELFNESTYIPFIPVTPLYSFSPILSDAYSWDVEEKNEESGWVLINAKLNPGYDYTVKSYRIKVDIENAIVLELTTFNANDEIEDSIEVQELLINDHVKKLDLELVIPQDYTDLEKERQKLVQILPSWFETATDAIKNDPSFYDTIYSGEGNYLSLAVTVKENVDEETAKELAEQFLYAFTEEANASEGFSQQEISIWEQYGFDLLIFKPNNDKYTYKGVFEKIDENGMPIVKWE